MCTKVEGRSLSSSIDHNLTKKLPPFSFSGDGGVEVDGRRGGNNNDSSSNNEDFKQVWYMPKMNVPK